MDFFRTQAGFTYGIRVSFPYGLYCNINSVIVSRLIKLIVGCYSLWQEDPNLRSAHLHDDASRRA